MADLSSFERTWNIARLGEDYSDKPVDRIMDNYTQYLEANKPKEQPSTWEKIKNFGSGAAGRTLLGGLGTALAVGLTGGNAKDALSYGVIGAGNTAENLQRQQNLNQRWQQEQQRHQDYLNQQRQLQEDRFRENRELADINNERALQRMYLENELKMQNDAQKPKEYKDAERVAATYAARMKDAADILDAYEASGGGYYGNNGMDVLGKTLEKMPLIGSGIIGQTLSGYAKGDDLKKYEAARDNWIAANLRKESGAAIAAQEYADAYKQYFPAPGDTPETIEAKRKRRHLVEQGMIYQSGGAYDDFRNRGVANMQPSYSEGTIIADDNGNQMIMREGTWQKI